MAKTSSSQYKLDAINELVREKKGTYAEFKQAGMWPIYYNHSVINSVRDLKETLRGRGVSEIGMYPLYLITADSEPLSFESARENFRQIIEAITSQHGSPDWRVVACEVNWEDPTLFCSHSNKRIESAYAEDEDTQVAS